MTRHIDLLTIRETADALRVSPATVRRWIRADQLDAVTLPSGTKRVPAGELARIGGAK